MKGDDRPGDQLREKGYIHSESDNVFLRACLSPVNVHRIGKRLESVKRDADRQSDGKKGSFTSQYCRNVLQKKVGVFEYAEQKKIQHNGGNDDGAGLFAFAPITKALYKPAVHIVKQDGTDHKPDSFRLAPTVEQETEQEQYEIARRTETARNHEVKQENKGEKLIEKNQAAEYHEILPPLSGSFEKNGGRGAKYTHRRPPFAGLSLNRPGLRQLP